MKVISARRFQLESGDLLVRVQVHLDTTRTTTDSKGATVPDPAWCHERTWQVPGRQTARGETAAQALARLDTWLTDTKAEFKVECAARLAALTTPPDVGTALAIEGQAL